MVYSEHPPKAHLSNAHGSRHGRPTYVPQSSQSPAVSTPLSGRGYMSNSLAHYSREPIGLRPSRPVHLSAVRSAVEGTVTGTKQEDRQQQGDSSTSDPGPTPIRDCARSQPESGESEDEPAEISPGKGSGRGSKSRETEKDNPPDRKRNENTGLFFDTYEEAIQVAFDLEWSFPANDPTVPTTDAEKQAWVKKLVKAFLNRRGILDKQTGPVLNARWLQRREDGSYCDYYGEDSIERVCWDLVHTVVRMHRDGLEWIPVFDSETWAKGFKESDITFKERMEALCKLFKYFKNRCDKMMKGENRWGTILAPMEASKTARNNRDANDERHKMLHLGREKAKADEEKQEKPAQRANGKRPYKRRQLATREQSAAHRNDLSLTTDIVPVRHQPSSSPHPSERDTARAARANYAHRYEHGAPIPNRGQLASMAPSGRSSIDPTSAYSHDRRHANHRRAMHPQKHDEQEWTSVAGGYDLDGPPQYLPQTPGSDGYHTRGDTYLPTTAGGANSPRSAYLHATMPQVHTRAPTPRQNIPLQAMVGNTGQHHGGNGFAGHHGFTQNMGHHQAGSSSALVRKRESDHESLFGSEDSDMNPHKRHHGEH